MRTDHASSQPPPPSGGARATANSGASNGNPMALSTRSIELGSWIAASSRRSDDRASPCDEPKCCGDGFVKVWQGLNYIGTVVNGQSSDMFTIDYCDCTTAGSDECKFRVQVTCSDVGGNSYLVTWFGYNWECEKCE